MSLLERKKHNYFLLYPPPFMAFSSKHFFVLFLTVLPFCHVRARDSQFFNKIPSNNVNFKETEFVNKEEEEQQPKFIPQTETGYGLYGHESGQLPPSTTTNNNLPFREETEENLNKDLPENYNNRAYVTKPRGGYTTTAAAENLPYRGQEMEETVNNKDLPDNYNTRAYVTKPQGGYSQYRTTANLPYREESEETFDEELPENYNTRAYSTKPQGMSDTRFTATTAVNRPYNAEFSEESFHKASPENYNTESYVSRPQSRGNSYNSGNTNLYNVEKQGMSDTRYLENGKYYYDVNTEGYNGNSRGMGSYQNRGYFGKNNENSFEGYQQNEELP